MQINKSKKQFKKRVQKATQKKQFKKWCRKQPQKTTLKTVPEKTKAGAENKGKKQLKK